MNSVGNMVLSLFPGVGLLDRAFEEHGFAVVRGPDRIHGGDVATWNVPAAVGVFDGIIAGPPCQGFSVANCRRHDGGHVSVRTSRRLLQWTADVVAWLRPRWAIIENVPTVPDVAVAGYSVQRIAINDFECGGRQLRWRTPRSAGRTC